jgi:hypothetical protein
VGDTFADIDHAWTLVKHWNGSQWVVVPSPNASDINFLMGVSAVGPDDVWASGYYSDGAYHPFLQHWDGNAWSIVPSPDVTHRMLYGIAAVASDNVWTVGTGGLIEHWDGSQWSIVPSGSTAELRDITTLTPSDIWAVGGTNNTSGDSVALHWDGTQWSEVPTPRVGTGLNELHAVDGIASDDVWAVGTFQSGTALYRTMMLHWDGVGWSVVPSPNIGDSDNNPGAVEVIASDDVWATGEYFDQVAFNYSPLVMHWDGVSWSVGTLPDHSGLSGLAAISTNDVWAVGYHWDTSSSYSLIEHYTNSCFTATPTVTGTPPTSTSTRTVTPTRSATGTRTVTQTGTSTPSATITPTPTRTVTGTPPTNTRTVTPGGATNTPALTWTATPTHFPYCTATATPGPSSCSDPQNGTYAYQVSFEGICFEPVQEVGVLYTPKLDISANQSGPWMEYYTGQQEWVDLGHGGFWVPVTGTLTVGTIPPPNNWYRIRVDYVTSYGGQGSVQTNGYPVCGAATLTPTVVPSNTSLATIVSATATNTSGTASATATSTATPTCRPWVERAAYPTTAFSLMATSLNGDVYAFGGRDANYVRLTSAYRYNPTQNAWTSLAPMLQKCFWCSAIAVNGQIYIVNGSHDNGPASDSSIYNPATNTWSAGGSGLVATYGQSVVYAGNKLYRIGGIGEGGYTNTVEDYGHALLAPLPNGVAWAQAVAIFPYIYVAGGSTDIGTVDKTYRYDINTNTWDDAAIADMPEPRAWAASGIVNGKWVIVGGERTENSAVAWDPQSNAWSYIEPPLFPRGDMGGAVVNVTNLYLVAGLAETFDNEVTAQVQKYEPALCATATATGTATVTATVTSEAATPTACPIEFSDAPVGSTFYEFIRCLACRGIINGYPDGTFKPNNLVTRGQLSKIVANAAGFVDPQTAQMFEDVPVGSTFFDFIGRLASRGYIAGYPCSGAGEPCNPPSNLPYFRPNNNATRGQISKIVSNAAGFSEPVSGQTFEDVPPGSTFYDFIERLASRGVMSGYPCGAAGEPCVPPGNLPYFRPNSNATRGQTSKIVANTFFPNCSPPLR